MRTKLLGRPSFFDAPIKHSSLSEMKQDKTFTQTFVGVNVIRTTAVNLHASLLL